MKQTYKQRQVKRAVEEIELPVAAESLSDTSDAAELVAGSMNCWRAEMHGVGGHPIAGAAIRPATAASTPTVTGWSAA